MINKPKIFTFWEPKESRPAYIQLCMQTWNKFLPEYEIIIVDYSNIENYLDKELCDKILHTDFPLSVLSDAIKCALLQRHSGIWFDADTIITSSQVKEYLNIESEFITIEHHLAFIKASKNSYILNKWLKSVKYRLKFYKNQKYSKTSFISIIERIIHIKLFKNLEKWDYLGNSILYKYLRKNIPIYILTKLKLTNFKLYKYFKDKYNKTSFKLDRVKLYALPEKIIKKDITDSIQRYIDFYFKNDYSNEILKNTKGIILLHNSWTPEEYKNMNKEEFLKQDNTLSNILKVILSK